MAERCESAHATAERVRSGERSAPSVMDEALERIARSEPAVQAWQHLDPALARVEAGARDEAGAKGPLAGVPVGLKDIIDTRDWPTENGVATDRGRRPAADATVVTRLRRAGAAVVGKTVTTECAFFTAPKTRNPHDPSRTPGGSSSGSGAAVGGGMVPLALGSQTVGSVLRPASFCGAWAMKPSFGLIPRTGMMRLAPTLDHVGVFGRSVEDLATAVDVLAGDDGADPATAGRAASRLAPLLAAKRAKLRLAFVRDHAWSQVEPATATLVEDAAHALDAEPLDLPPELADVVAVQDTIMKCEMAHCLGPRYEADAAKLTPVLREAIEEGRAVSAERYLAALDSLAAMRRAVRSLSAFDAAVGAVVTGEAPKGLAWTGSPALCLLWTTLGVPTLTVPAFTGPAGLPVGLQVIGAWGADAGVLRAAAWIAERLDVPPLPGAGSPSA